MKKLNAGCGRDIRAGYINMDKAKLEGVDIIHNLDVYPYPFPDNFFDEIFCQNVLEHLIDVGKTMEEFYRILKPNGILKLIIPHYNHPDAYMDFTHKHFFTFAFPDFFSEGHNLDYYTKARFKCIKKKMHGGTIGSLIPHFLRIWIALYIGNIGRSMHYELEAIK